ncbi:MAG: shikimate kinase [Myxococcales bacterium]|nr:shikimate kinase [Myxococcales bacterium]
MSLWLVGARGAGKTSAGARAAALLGVELCDTDAAIERACGRPVRAIFATEGEAAFRVLERELVLAALLRPGRIVATGGGAVLDPEVRARLARHPGTVWLSAPPAVLAARIRGSDRPSLTGAPIEEELLHVAALRAPLYAEASRAGRVVDTAALGTEEVAAALAELWRSLPHAVGPERRA